MTNKINVEYLSAEIDIWEKELSNKKEQKTSVHLKKEKLLQRTIILNTVHSKVANEKTKKAIENLIEELSRQSNGLENDLKNIESDINNYQEILDSLSKIKKEVL